MSVLVIKWLGLGSVENPMVVAQTVKNLLAVQETWVWSLSQEDPPHPPGKEWWPTPVFLPGESHGQRSLAGCSLWGH